MLSVLDSNLGPKRANRDIQVQEREKSQQKIQNLFMLVISRKLAQ